MGGIDAIGAGTVLAGRFELVRPLRDEGRVWLAVQHPLEREVAVRIVELSDDDASSSFDAAFEAEARKIGRIGHANAVHLYDHGHDGARFYLAMEHVEGLSLAELVRERHVLPVSQAIHIVRQVCAALDTAHRAGIVHGGLTPGAVLLAPQTGGIRVKVDFALAGLEPADETFLAPEQRTIDGADHRADLWAVGAMAHLALTGRHPLASGARRTLADDGVDLPPCVQWTLDRCMADEPGERLGSAAHVARALNACELAVRHAELSGTELAVDAAGAVLLPPRIRSLERGFDGVVHPARAQGSESGNPRVMTGLLAVAGGLALLAGLAFLAMAMA